MHHSIFRNLLKLQAPLGYEKCTQLPCVPMYEGEGRTILMRSDASIAPDSVLPESRKVDTNNRECQKKKIPDQPEPVSFVQCREVDDDHLRPISAVR